mgnify:CR=1 FL=1
MSIHYKFLSRIQHSVRYSTAIIATMMTVSRISSAEEDLTYRPKPSHAQAGSVRYGTTSKAAKDLPYFANVADKTIGELMLKPSSGRTAQKGEILHAARQLKQLRDGVRQARTELGADNPANWLMPDASYRNIVARMERIHKVLEKRFWDVIDDKIDSIQDSASQQVDSVLALSELAETLNGLADIKMGLSVASSNRLKQLSAAVIETRLTQSQLQFGPNFQNHDDIRALTTAQLYELVALSRSDEAVVTGLFSADSAAQIFEWLPTTLLDPMRGTIDFSRLPEIAGYNNVIGEIGSLRKIRESLGPIAKAYEFGDRHQSLFDDIDLRMTKLGAHGDQILAAQRRVFGKKLGTELSHDLLTLVSLHEAKSSSRPFDFVKNDEEDGSISYAVSIDSHDTGNHMPLLQLKVYADGSKEMVYWQRTGGFASGHEVDNKIIGDLLGAALDKFARQVPLGEQAKSNDREVVFAELRAHLAALD